MSVPNLNPVSFRTNISSLIGQLSLNRSTSLFNTSIRNLSTGIRVHSGRDDPSAFLASSMMESDIASLTQAVANCQRANTALSMADSALSTVNSLLIDLRGLVTEAANSGPTSEEGLEALQLQIDSTLDTINRIASSTQYLDKTLLDGSLDFTTYGVDDSKAEQVVIHQANFEGRTEKEVSVKVLETAQQAGLHYAIGATTDKVVLQITGNLGSQVFEFDKNADVQSIAEAVNRSSDSTGVGARIYSEATNGSIALTSYGDDNDILLTASQAGSLAGNIVVAFTADREGNDTLGVNFTAGQGNTPAQLEVLLRTEPGGKVLTTAEELVDFLNTAPELRGTDGSGLVTAALPTGTTGRGTVSAFSEYSYYGDTDDSNRLQFLAPAGSPTIRFVSEPNSTLSIDDTTYPPTYGYSTADVQGLDMGTSFSLRALAQGKEYDGTQVQLVDAAEEGISYDAATGIVRISVDFSGRAADPARGAWTMNDMKALVESEPSVADHFAFVPETSYDAANPPAFTSADYRGIDTTLAVFSGGLIDPGMLTVHLETDSKGVVKTTANDLVHFFNYPTTEESREVLDRYGISVSSIDPSNPTLPSCTLGLSELGTGVLKPSYDPNECTDAATQIAMASTHYPDAVFQGSSSAFGDAVRLPETTLFTSGGKDAVLTIQARQADTGIAGVEVDVISDPAVTEPEVRFDFITRQLHFVLPPDGSLTAAEAVNLVNSSDATREWFLASIPSNVPGSSTPPDGQGTLRLGDRGTFTVPEVPLTGAPLLGNSDNMSLGVTFHSLDYGSSAFVSVIPQSGTFSLTDRDGDVAQRAVGVDVKAMINDSLAVGVGKTASTITNDLDIAIQIGDDVKAGEVFGIRITGGGALMQLGRDANYSQQARISLPSIHVTELGGVYGKLDDLRTGNACSVANDVKGAYQIVEAAISQVTLLRGRIGAFQKTQVEANMDQLLDSIEITYAANAEIKDTDFAEWTSKMSRSQLMVETATAMLQKTQENSRGLLSLLQG